MRCKHDECGDSCWYACPCGEANTPHSINGIAVCDRCIDAAIAVTFNPELWIPGEQALKNQITTLRRACATSNEDICQTLGRALGYPRFCDDQKNFPGSTDEDGVCVGEHVAESIAAEAAARITSLTAELAKARETDGGWKRDE